MTRRAALLGLGTAAVSGCSFSPVTFSPTGAPTAEQSTDPTVTLEPEFYARAKNGAVKTLAEGSWIDQRFSTPHLDGTLVNCFVGESLGPASAAQLGLDTPIRAPEGHELVAFTLRGGRPSFLETVEGSTPEVQLVVGDRRIPIVELFNAFSTEADAYVAEWEMVALCLPAGDDVVLEVTDEGRTIALDLRTGVPLVDADWKATLGFRQRWDIECDPVNAVFTREFTTMPPAGVETESGELSIGLQPDMINGLLPWTPAQGWAPEDMQWLVVPMHAKADWTSRLPPQFDLRVPQSFMYRHGTAELVPATQPESITVAQIDRGQAELEVVWPVGQPDGGAAIVFNAVGDLEMHYTDAGPVAAQFSSAPEPLEFTLSFNPAQG